MQLFKGKIGPYILKISQEIWQPLPWFTRSWEKKDALGACIWWLIRQHCYMKTQGIYIHGQVSIIDVHNIYCKYVWGIKTWVFTMIVLSYYHNVWGNYVRGLGTWSTLYNVKGTTVSYLRIQYFSVLFIHEYEVIDTLPKDRTQTLYN